MKFDLSRAANPIINLNPAFSARDPAAVYDGTTMHIYFSALSGDHDYLKIRLGACHTLDLAHMGEVSLRHESELNFSSPGNIFRHNGRWAMCLQSYPFSPGKLYPGENCRLWVSYSDDLHAWDPPEMLKPEGCTAQWAHSRRQIDPYIIDAGGQYYCFYKTGGCIGVMVSEDLADWKDTEKPAISSSDTPDGVTVENPCVIPYQDGYVMFFAPCRLGRGIGTARSMDLLCWEDIRYLDFPAVRWAEGGLTAPFVIDMRKETGRWLMFFHGDNGPHLGAMLGIAWSDDLERWVLP